MAKFKSVFVLLLILTLFVSACSKQAPTNENLTAKTQTGGGVTTPENPSADSKQGQPSETPSTPGDAFKLGGQFKCEGEITNEESIWHQTAYIDAPKTFRNEITKTDYPGIVFYDLIKQEGDQSCDYSWKTGGPTQEEIDANVESHTNDITKFCSKALSIDQVSAGGGSLSNIKGQCTKYSGGIDTSIPSGRPIEDLNQLAQV